jgi:hypothetical protein
VLNLDAEMQNANLDEKLNLHTVGWLNCSRVHQDIVSLAAIEQLSRPGFCFSVQYRADHGSLYVVLAIVPRWSSQCETSSRLVPFRSKRDLHSEEARDLIASIWLPRRLESRLTSGEWTGVSIPKRSEAVDLVQLLAE